MMPSIHSAFECSVTSPVGAVSFTLRSFFSAEGAVRAITSAWQARVSATTSGAMPFRIKGSDFSSSDTQAVTERPRPGAMNRHSRKERRGKR